MQAVIELTVNLMAALAIALLAQIGIAGQGADDQPRSERVVARSPQAQAAPAAPQRAVGCPEAHIVAPMTV